MKKISYLIFILIAFIVLIPRVDAKEIDVSNLEFDKEIEVEEGDKITYDGNERDDNYNLVGIFYHDENGHRVGEKSIDKLKYEFTIPTYKELMKEDIQEGKRVLIKLYLTMFCMPGSQISVDYTLVDDVKKNVVYNNTFDAVNNNPESYYTGEADILLEDIKRDGYKFLGWYTTSDYQEDSRITTITKGEDDTLQLYAKWEKIENEVKVDTIDENPNTYTTTYVIAGIFIILMLSTVIVYVYGKKNNI